MWPNGGYMQPQLQGEAQLEKVAEGWTARLPSIIDELKAVPNLEGVDLEGIGERVQRLAKVVGRRAHPFAPGVGESLGAVLTLPGIAGIILTIGMSVDANVLIYERIREELRNGKGLSLAISDGYNSAYSSIIDANVTTLLTGIILYTFGTGPIKGFATTLVIGILTSLFAAIFITRLVVSARLAKGKTISFATKMTDGAFKNINIDFIGKRKRFYILSSVIILIGIGSLVTKGLNYGVDFIGGRTYVVRFDETVNNEYFFLHLFSHVFYFQPRYIQ